MSRLAHLLPKLVDFELLTLVLLWAPGAGLRPICLLHLRGRTEGRHRRLVRQVHAVGL